MPRRQEAGQGLEDRRVGVADRLQRRNGLGFVAAEDAGVEAAVLGGIIGQEIDDVAIDDQFDRLAFRPLRAHPVDEVGQGGLGGKQP